MQFDPQNTIVKLCAEGIEKEAINTEETRSLYQQAWEKASNDFEKFIAAHYMARVQNGTSEKLDWDLLALSHAQKCNTDEMKENYPSLYLNIAKGYEDLNDIQNASKYYKLALSFAELLPENGYGEMIKSGILNGIARVS